MNSPQKVRESDLTHIAGEAISLAGGGRALLLQIAHPAIGRGVVEHSDFSGRMMERFHATMTFVYASVFAAPEEFDAVRAQVNRAHIPVHDPQSGELPAYNAFDPELQLWVASTLYSTMIQVNERVFGPLTPAARERAYLEFTQLGLNLQLQLQPQHWPDNTVEFQRYWDDTVSRLRATGATRAVAAQILHPSGVPFWLRTALPNIRLVTTGLLPPIVRDQFQLRWNPSLEHRFERRMRWAASIYPRLPEQLRHRPRDLYLRQLREKLRQTSSISDRSAHISEGGH